MRRYQAVQYRGPLIAALSGIACLMSSSAVPPAAAEPATEQQAFNNACRTCHLTKEGDNRLGPNLHKIVGRKAGSLPDYRYSSPDNCLRNNQLPFERLMRSMPVI